MTSSILVIDDDAGIRLLCRMNLERGDVPALIVLDLMMSQMDGVEGAPPAQGRPGDRERPPGRGGGCPDARELVGGTTVTLDRLARHRDE